MSRTSTGSCNTIMSSCMQRQTLHVNPVRGGVRGLRGEGGGVVRRLWVEQNIYRLQHSDCVSLHAGTLYCILTLLRGVESRLHG